MLLRIDTEERGETLHVSLSGEFDASSIERFRALVEPSTRPWRRVDVDLSDVVFMDSTALGVLLGFGERAREDGCEVTLVRPSHAVASLLELTGLDARFAVRD